MNNHQSTPDAIEQLLNQAQNAINELQNESALSSSETSSSRKETVQDAQPSTGPTKVNLSEIINAFSNPDSAVNLDAIKDIQLDVRVVLGETEAPLEDIMRLRKGSVVQLDAQSSDPVSIIVNGQVVARGEALNRNGKFCVRLTEKLIE